jgi:hypothetical protein
MIEICEIFIFGAARFCKFSARNTLVQARQNGAMCRVENTIIYAGGETDLSVVGTIDRYDSDWCVDLAGPH